MSVLYRYVSSYPNDDEGELASIVLYQFQVVKESESSYWIKVPYYLTRPKNTKELKLVRKGAMRTFAYPTKELALENYRIRTSRYLSILEYSVTNVKRCLALIDSVDVSDTHIGHVTTETKEERLKFLDME